MMADTMIHAQLGRVEPIQAVSAEHERIAVVGLGYVGLPLCLALARHHRSVTGFDISSKRITALAGGRDSTGEVTGDDLRRTTARLTGDAAELATATFYIVTVPTPIDALKQPDLGPLTLACEIIGLHLKPGDIVVFESTVYPGVTEEVCGPILARQSGLRAGVDFNLGYSPERINPGDRERTVETIVKVVAGDTPASLARICAVYGRAITAGLHCAPSIKVAECAKAIENTQRDVNIALMNELAQICERLGLHTSDVIEAASTKWNFQRFQPGLVGGHCIGVDPYYLAALADGLGLKADVILAARRVNDDMAAHVAEQAMALLQAHRGSVERARIGVFGMTFKEDVPDIRNSKSFDLVRRLRELGAQVLVHDPIAAPDEMARADVALSSPDAMRGLDLMIVAVAHKDYRAPDFLRQHLARDGVLVDVKSIFSRTKLPKAVSYWSL